MKIAIDAALCLKKKFPNATCTACRDVCPTNSINDSVEVNGSCMNCGLCLASCPAEAIAGNSYGVEPIRQLIATKDSIRLSCRKCLPDSPWPCLGFLDPILLLTFVYSGQNTDREVAIYHQDCTLCNPDVAKHITKIIEEANQLLGPDKKAVVSSSEKGYSVTPQAISRRQFFAELWGASVSTVREVAFPVSDRLEPMPRRELFLDHNGSKFLPRYIDKQTTFKSMAINNSCKACGLCEKMCNKEAITTVLEEGTLEIGHDPVLCNNCGICAAQCPQGAISLFSAHSMEKSLVIRAGLPVCTSCGDWYQPIGHASVCLDCTQKAKIFSL